NSRNCQPGKYCILNDGASETIKYSTCTCDRGVYTDETSCKFNQTESGSCTNAEGKTFKKCYCNRSEGQFPHASCTYGPSVGARTCVDSSSGREYYSQCKTAEEACRTYDNDDSDDHDGKGGFQHADCSGVHNCTTKEKVYYNGSWQYLTSYNCILGEMCPYPTNPSLYKCVFDKASWCSTNGYKQSTSSKMSNNSICTTPEGIQGKVENCPANDNAALYYYKCKITCDQRVLQVAAGSGLNTESLGLTGHGIGGRFGSKKDISGVERPIAYWTYLSAPKNGFRKGYHLFLRGDVRLPDGGLSYNANNRDGDTIMRADGNSNNPIYQSVNGIAALYQLDPTLYSDCQDDYENVYTNPTLTIPLNGKYANTHMFSRDLHNINIKFSRRDNNDNHQNWGRNIFYMDNQKDLGGNGNGETGPVSTYVWKNMRMYMDEFPETGHCDGSDFGDGVNADMKYLRERTVISLMGGVKLRFTGNIDFSVSTWAFENLCNVPNSEQGADVRQSMGGLTIHSSQYGIIEFKDANVSGSSSWYGEGTSGDHQYEYNYFPDFDADCGTDGQWDTDSVMVIDNSTVYGNNHFGCLHLNMKNNSTYTLMHMYSRAVDEDYGKTVWSGFVNRGGQHCVGTYLKDSTLNIMSKHGVTDIRRFLYLNNSKVNSNNPIRLMNNGDSRICIGDSTSALNVNVNGNSATYGKGSYKYTAGANYETAADKYHVGYMSNEDRSKRIMYSAGHGACIPWELNRDPGTYYSWDGSSKDYYNPWWKVCSGNPGPSSPNYTEDSKKKNWMPDDVSMNTPAKFDVRVSYYATEKTTIQPWYPRNTSKTSTWRCDFDSRYYYQEQANLYMCSSSATEKNAQWSDYGFDTYYAGQCRDRQFLCSACSHCANGIGYSDWSDTQGGL
ncbi:MAG: hypothetical protein IJ529_02755, partial [Alphaproteobacteria bacterium]|nr:hypothetical protein [Alphaproteobacteria bacterium]